MKNDLVLNEDYVTAFELKKPNFRGRIVKLSAVIDDILNAHSYPEQIARLVGETATLATLLSSYIKYEGIFTLQAQGTGCIKMLVSDVQSDGMLRASCTYDHSVDYDQKINAKANSTSPLKLCLGEGHLAFTVDNMLSNERYQGIVELKGDTLAACVNHYFQQSEQVLTGTKVVASKTDGKWRAGGIILQKYPEDTERAEIPASDSEEDDWRRCMLLLETCSEDELLEGNLDSALLLYRLFHEEELFVREKQRFYKGCRCNVQRVENILKSLGSDEIQDLSENNKLIMTCEFCSKNYEYSLAQALSLKNLKKNTT